MSTFTTGIVILWTLPLGALLFLAGKYAYESWDEARWANQENRAVDLLKRWTLEQAALEALEAQWDLPAREPRRPA